MPRTLNTQNNLVELLSRAPSPWDSYDPRSDETPETILILVADARMRKSLADGTKIVLVDTPEAAQAVHEFLARKAG